MVSKDFRADLDLGKVTAVRLQRDGKWYDVVPGSVHIGPRSAVNAEAPQIGEQAVNAAENWFTFDRPAPVSSAIPFKGSWGPVVGPLSDILDYRTKD